MRTESLFKPHPHFAVTESNITISLLNTLSLKNDFMDVIMDTHLSENDVLFDRYHIQNPILRNLIRKRR